MVMFTEAMIIPALPTLEAEFNTTAAWCSWIVSIYLLVSAVAIPIFAKLGDSYGKKKFLLVCMTFYTIWRHRQRLCVEFTVAHSIQGPSRHGPGDVPARIRHHPGRIST